MLGKPRKTPVFLDPKGRRAKYINVALVAAGSFLAIGLTIFAVGVVWGPSLLPPRFADLPTIEASTAEARAASSHYEPPIGQIGIREPSEANTSALRFAFYSSDSAGSFLSLKEHADAIDGLLPDWYSLSAKNGTLKIGRSKETMQSVPWIRAHARHIAVFPRLPIYLSLPNVQQSLIEPQKREALTVEISHAVARDGFAGVTLELSSVPAPLIRPLLDFVGALGQQLRDGDRKLIVSFDPELDAHLVRKLSMPADYVVLQAADELPLRANTGAVASQGWFEEMISKGLSVIPAKKLIVGVGAFGYDFDAFGNEHLISVQRAWDLLSQTGAELRFDKRSMSSTFVYKASNGHWHQVWFTDAVSVYNQLRTAFSVSPAAIAIWRLGLEDPGIWKFTGRETFPDRDALASLTVIPPGHGGLSFVNGALLQIVPGHDGARAINFNPALGLIDNEVVTTYPSFATVTAIPATDEKLVALTFDDGPDDRYTPQVLDILAEKDVKATFYIVGQNAFGSLGLLKRIYREGHDLGNHSFSHPDLNDSSPARIAAELNATQRLFQSQLGVTTILLRAPYQGPELGFLESSPTLIKTANGLGYFWGPFNVDSDDFRRQPYQSDWIVSDVLHQVAEVRQSPDNQSAIILLMHDSGGNRQATLKSLPEIIDSLKADGYRFVTTHELVGLSREAVMPRSDPTDFLLETESTLRLASIQTLSWVSDAIPPIAIVTAVLGTLRLSLVVLMASIRHARSSRDCSNRADAGDVPGSVAVLVPAHNEESVICKTVGGLLASRSSKSFDIIVIDDGSTDDTAEIVRTTFASEPRVKVFKKKNGGKSSALNLGYHKTKADIVVAIDGDTVLEPDAVEQLIQPFRDPKVGAVAGNVVVGNQLNLLTRFQALEYVTSQRLDRVAFEPFNAICVVPGAIGAWRRKAVLKVGGYSDDNLAEDADLTVRLALSGWRIASSLHARALTEAPETMLAFLKQRFRWMFGMLQVAFKHRGALVRRPTGISLICIPNILIFQFGFTLLAPLMDAILSWTLLMSVAAAFGIASAPTESLIIIGGYWIVFQTVDMLAAAAGIHFNGERRYWLLLPLVLLQRFTYRQLLYWTAIKVLLAALRGVFVGWGRLARSGNVPLPTYRAVGA
ncbi:glycosyltransferase [Methyloligella sp. 2.7D]|uniref:glycosyltransferase n=1 Tax=unclassified Methyloligella TaxID=2625955 RepID=UPI00157E1DC4|nr:glycosyltransferase [Methyloligella sp. GL2]QKP76555.1 glycosyltransferase [Methyloligella sp. GL2]